MSLRQGPPRPPYRASTLTSVGVSKGQAYIFVLSVASNLYEIKDLDSVMHLYQ